MATINRLRVATERRSAGAVLAGPSASPAPQVQDNFTDLDSRIMKTSAGFEQCYNGQTAVDGPAPTSWPWN